MAESLEQMAERAERIIQGECENSNVRMLDLGGGSNIRNLGIAVVTGTYNPDTNTILLAAVCKDTVITLPEKSEENLPMAPQDPKKSMKTKGKKKKRNGKKLKNITERRESARIRQRMESSSKEEQTIMEGGVGGNTMQPIKSQDYEESRASKDAKDKKEKMDQNDKIDKNKTENRKEQNGIKIRNAVEEPMKLRSRERKEKIAHIEPKEKDPKEVKLKDLKVIIEKFEPLKEQKPAELRDRKKNLKNKERENERGGKKNERKESYTNVPEKEDEQLELKNKANRASERLKRK